MPLYPHTEINRSLSCWRSLKRDRWARHDDTLGLAAVVNGLSGAAREYFAAGGTGILIGDGTLGHGPEKILEACYSLKVNKPLSVALNYQHMNNPAYNRGPGPASIYGLRIHSEF